jgi:hypothetical protein
VSTATRISIADALRCTPPARAPDAICWKDGSLRQTPSRSWPWIKPFRLRAAAGCLLALSSLLGGCGGGGSGGSDSPPSAPSAQALSFTAAEDGLLAGQLSGQVAAGRQIRFELLTTPSNGTVVIDETTGSFSYTPRSNFFGEDRFTYRVGDGNTTSAAAAITLTVASVNDAPTLTLASAPKFATPGEIARLTMSSVDIDGDVASIRAAQLSGPKVAALAATSTEISFVAPQTQAATPVRLRVTAIDNEGAEGFLDLSLMVHAISSEGTLRTIAGSTAAPGLHWVLVGDGYVQSERTKFLNDAAAIVEHVLDRSPVDAYREAWNIHLLFVDSAETGTDVPSLQIERATAFGGTLECFGVARLACVDWSLVAPRVIDHVPNYDFVQVVLNTDRYGGGASSTGSVVTVHAMSAEVSMHELGHSFAGLADEYVDSAIESVRVTFFNEGAYPNVTQLSDPAAIKWRHWFPNAASVATQSPSTQVGRFEGAFYRAAGFYRPKDDTFMRSLGAEIGEVNAEVWALAVYRLIDPMITSHPSALTIQVDPQAPAAFSISKPFSNSVQQVRWLLDGQEIAGTRDRDTIECCNNLAGTHVLRATVTDRTGLIRRPGATAMNAERAWTLVANPSTSNPRISLTSNEGTIAPGGTVTLSWTTTNVSSCMASGAWDGSQPTAGSFVSPPLTESASFLLACVGPAGTTTRVVQILVTADAAAPAATLFASPEEVDEGDDVTLTWTSSGTAVCAASGGWAGAKTAAGAELIPNIGQNGTFHLACSGPNGVASAMVQVTVRPRAPTALLEADPVTVLPNTISMLKWNAQTATSCIASGDWSGPRATSGTQPVGPLTSPGLYRIACTGAGGTASSEVVIGVAAVVPAVVDPVELYSVDFVELRGRPMHEGLFKVSSEPVDRGAPQTILVRLIGRAGTPTFQFVTEAGEPIATLPLTRAVGSTDELPQFSEMVSVPTTPFQLRASGIDAEGRSYQVQSRTFEPRRFEARPPAGLLSLVVGAEFTFPIAVANYGAAGPFELRVVTTGAVVLQSSSTQTLTMAQAETRTVNVAMRIAPSAQPFDTETISVSIAPTSDPQATNQSETSVLVIAPEQ